MESALSLSLQCPQSKGTVFGRNSPKCPSQKGKLKLEGRLQSWGRLGGMSRTGLALSKGFSIRPLKVLELRGQKLELQLLDIAEQQEVDEFIIGLPKSFDGKETPQSNKVCSVAGRFAARAAES